MGKWAEARNRELSDCRVIIEMQPGAQCCLLAWSYSERFAALGPKIAAFRPAKVQMLP